MSLKKCLSEFLVVFWLLEFAIGSAFSQERISQLGPPKHFFVLVDISGSMLDSFPAPVQPRLADANKLSDVKYRLDLLAEHLPLSTHLVVATFDSEHKTIFDGLIDSEDSRTKLKEVFKQIESREGSTYLWKTLDHYLDRATNLTESDAGRCRVLLYSDGKDEEKKINHEDLIKKYGKNLASNIRLDWVCIGYELAKEIQEGLGKVGVQFTSADKPDDLAPIVARFELSANRLSVGETLKVTNTSLVGSDTQATIDWGDGSPTTKLTGSDASHRYEKSGAFEVVMTIQSKSGMMDRCLASLIVDLPLQVPTVVFLESNDLMISEHLIAFDRTGVPSARTDWYLDEHLVASNIDKVRLAMSTSGDHTLELRRTDGYGRISSDKARVKVSEPPKPVAPVAKISYPANYALGQPSVFRSVSTGPIDRIVWIKNGKSIGTDTVLPIPSSELEPGTHVLELRVEGPGGSSTDKHTFEIPLPPLPKASFRLALVPAPKIGVPLLGFNESDTAVAFQWLVNDMKVSEERHLDWIPKTSGPAQVTLYCYDRYGQSSQHSVRVDIPALLPPTASLTFGSDAPYVGDTMTITDTTQGDWNTVDITVDLAGKLLGKYTLVPEDTSRAIKVNLDSTGPLIIRLVATGPGGNTEVSKSVMVSSRRVAPLAKFVIDRTVDKRGLALVEFLDESSGDYDRIEFDAGDGSPVRNFGRGERILHGYKTSGHRARIVLHSDQPELASSSWVSDPVLVRTPIANWMIIAGLGSTVSTALGTVLWGVRRFLRKRKEHEERLKVAGRLLVGRRGGLNINAHDFEGNNFEEIVSLDPNSQIRLTCIDSDNPRFQAELLVDGQGVESCEFDDEGNAKVGQYELTLM
jgi:plastocyanin